MAGPRHLHIISIGIQFLLGNRALRRQLFHTLEISKPRLVGGASGLDSRLLRIDLAESLDLRRVRLGESDINGAALAGDLGFELSDLGFRLFDGEIHVRGIDHHEHVPLLHPVPLLHRFLDEPPADGVKSHLHLLGGEDPVLSLLRLGHRVVALVEQ